MANSTSIILYPSDSQRQLLLAETGEQSLQASRYPSGPGRTLDEIYTAAGLLVGKNANKAAHHLGLGPCAVARRICAFFGDGREREEKLEKLRTVSDDSHTLKKDCIKLMGYTLPSESSQTQLQAFKSIITLTTRYPGIRCLFLGSKHIQRVGVSEETILKLWNRGRESCGQEWDFMFHFAAACLADQDISAMVEDSQARAVASIENDLSMAERLLVASDCEGVSKFSKHIAVRYLGGILELPSFWIQEGAIHEAVVKKIYRRTTGILQDLGIDSAEGEDSGVLADHDGIDTLCAALLTGTRVWMLDKAATHFTGESWFNSLLEFIQLLRHPRSEDLLPKAWIISQDLRTIIPTPYRLQEVDVLVEQGLQPTRANILAAITVLVKDAISNAFFFLHYSGHSTQIPNEDGSEDDGMDECLVPLGGESQMIVDDELNAVLAAPLPDSRLVAVLDTCHSGALLDLKHYRSKDTEWVEKGRQRSEVWITGSDSDATSTTRRAVQISRISPTYVRTQDTLINVGSEVEAQSKSRRKARWKTFARS
ncbi:caspase domain-containing protein [Mycena rebaudengoi]|nr:caspase domain-containing protein [Mycena rebaudengoi]